MSRTGYAFNKTYAQTKHAEKRARERYGIEMSPARHARVGQLILAGIIRGTRHEFSKYSIYEFDWRLAEPDTDPQTVKIAYDTQTNRVATFLPPHWTPDSGLDHYLDGQREKTEAAELAKAEMFRKTKAAAENAIASVHPIPRLTGDAVQDDAMVRDAIKRLQADHDDDTTYKFLRSERLRVFEQMLKTLKPRIREINRLEHEARQVEAARLAREKKLTKSAPKPRPVLSDEEIERHIDNYAHALSQAVKELVEDRAVREAIFKRARKIVRVLRKEQHAASRRIEAEYQDDLVPSENNDGGGDDAVLSQVWTAGETQGSAAI